MTETRRGGAGRGAPHCPHRTRRSPATRPTEPRASQSSESAPHDGHPRPPSPQCPVSAQTRRRAKTKRGRGYATAARGRMQRRVAGVAGACQGTGALHAAVGRMPFRLIVHRHPPSALVIAMHLLSPTSIGSTSSVRGHPASAAVSAFTHRSQSPSGSLRDAAC